MRSQLKKKTIHYSLQQLQVHSKIKRKAQRFPIYSLFPHMHSLLHYQHCHQNGTILTYHHHPELIVCIGVPACVVYFINLDKFMMMCPIIVSYRVTSLSSKFYMELFNFKIHFSFYLYSFPVPYKKKHFIQMHNQNCLYGLV